MVDVTAQGNCTASSNSVEAVGAVSQVADGMTQPVRKYMSEEQNYLRLDGSFFTPPKNTDLDTSDSIGWWSSMVSDASAKFPASRPQLTLTFSEPFTSPGLTFIFSPLTGDYCAEVHIVTTDDGNNVNSYFAFPDAPSYFWSQQLNNITQLDITFYSTNYPYRRVRVAEILFGEQFLWSGDNIFDLDVLEEFDPLVNSAPPKEARATVANNLNNFNIYFHNLQKKQVMKPYLTLYYDDGSFETVPLGTYYLYNWRNDQNFISSTLYARDLLDLLSGTIFYKYTYSGDPVSLYDLAISIIEDFKSQTRLNVEYVMDTALQSITTTGVLSALNHHDALMYVAQAGLAVLYVDRYNVMRITQSKSQAPLTPMPYTGELALDMQETYPKVAIQDPYNYFTINVYSNSLSTNTDTLYTGAVAVDGDLSIWVKYANPASSSSCSCSVEGATLLSVDYYTDSAYVTINGSENATITITGNSVSSSVLQSVLNISGSQPLNEVDLDNPLITSPAMAAAVLNWYASECGNVYLYEVESWMDPSMECGDVIFWDSQYATETKQAKIIRQEFRFDGTLSGTINGKGWP
ncbi:hypothetical protein [Desulfosporosinus acididurans]|nr:hypothetical protein [Desulfosporosinus acididurans]